LRPRSNLFGRKRHSRRRSGRFGRRVLHKMVYGIIWVVCSGVKV
jgi:hypothetical protein